MSEKTLVKKLAKVMTEVKYIEKKGYNKFNNYKYATESDVAEKVREVLAEQNVIMLPDVVEHTTREHVNRKGNTEYIATVKVKFTFFDGDSGEELAIHSAGEGQDAGDKAVYKAITGAQKYALMKAFMIPTGDDPEADNGVDERNNTKQETQKASNKQLDYIDNLIKKKETKEHTWVVLYEGLKKRMQTDVDMENWTQQQASQAIKILSNGQEKKGA
jgi:hypothetical protein